MKAVFSKHSWNNCLKLCFLLCSVFGFISQGSAQTSAYFPFPDSNAVWRVSWYSTFSCSLPTALAEDYQYTMSGDTLIGSMMYSKVYKSGKRYCQSQVNSYCGLLAGLIRQDVPSRKVYIRQGAGDSLLYDFSLVVGQAVPYTIHGGVPGDTLVKIDSVLIGTKYRKRFNFKPYHSVPIIEGIGSEAGLLEPKFGFSTDDSWALGCYHDSVVSWFSNNSNTTCSLVNGINDFNSVKDQSHVFPNPARANSNIVIESRIMGQELAFRLSDSFGLMILNLSVSRENEQYLVTLPDLPPGLYVYSLSANNNDIYSRGKLIVQ